MTPGRDISLLIEKTYTLRLGPAERDAVTMALDAYGQAAAGLIPAILDEEPLTEGQVENLRVWLTRAVKRQISKPADEPVLLAVADRLLRA